MVPTGAWDDVRKAIIWGMTNPGADSGGQQKMCDAVRHGTTDYMGEFKDGFHDTFNGYLLVEFDACAHEDQGEVYNIGRQALGLPPV